MEDVKPVDPSEMKFDKDVQRRVSNSDSGFDSQPGQGKAIQDSTHEHHRKLIIFVATLHFDLFPIGYVHDSTVKTPNKGHLHCLKTGQIRDFSIKIRHKMLFGV